MIRYLDPGLVSAERPGAASQASGATEICQSFFTFSAFAEGLLILLIATTTVLCRTGVVPLPVCGMTVVGGHHQDDRIRRPCLANAFMARQKTTCP
jgi:hypothetical protein